MLAGKEVQEGVRKHPMRTILFRIKREPNMVSPRGFGQADQGLHVGKPPFKRGDIRTLTAQEGAFPVARFPEGDMVIAQHPLLQPNDVLREIRFQITQLNGRF